MPSSSRHVETGPAHKCFRTIASASTEVVATTSLVLAFTNTCSPAAWRSEDATNALQVGLV